MQRNKGKLSQTQTLDYLHKIAVEQSIVTPYSSMIVLVNDEQRRRLEELEKQGDRFQREKEQVGETVQPVVTACRAARVGADWHCRGDVGLVCAEAPQDKFSACVRAKTNQVFSEKPGLFLRVGRESTKFLQVFGEPIQRGLPGRHRRLLVVIGAGVVVKGMVGTS